MKSRAEIKMDAKRKLNAYWHIPVILTLILYLIEGLIRVIFFKNQSLYYIFYTISTAFLTTFSTSLFLKIAKNDDLERVKFSWIKIPSEKLFKCVVYSLIMALATTFIKYFGNTSILLALAILIFVAVLEVYLSFSLLIILDTDATILDAVKSSLDLIEGRFWQVVIFSLSFVLWFLLGIITLGVGLLWVFPYFGVSFANYYLNLKYTKNLI